MYYVYLMESRTEPSERYVGFTTDLKARLKTHDEGGSIHTRRHRPWRLVTYHAFASKRSAQAFEYYLKSGSGRAFANKRLWTRSSST